MWIRRADGGTAAGAVLVKAGSKRDLDPARVRHWQWTQRPGTEGSLVEQVHLRLSLGAAGLAQGDRVALCEQDQTFNGNTFRRSSIKPGPDGSFTFMLPRTWRG